MAQQTVPKVDLPSDDVFAEAEFSRGFVRDMPRSSIPVGGVYDIVDYFIDRPGVAYKRGGTVYQGGDLGSNTGGVGFVAAAEFPPPAGTPLGLHAGLRIFGLGADGNVYDITSGSTSLGALGITTVDNPALFVDRVVIPASDGVTGPKKVFMSGGTLTLGTWGGSPPPGRICTVHLSRVVLANSEAHPNRIWFSPVPNPESTWDADPSTGKAYLDTNHFLSGITPCQGVLLAFSPGRTERIIGDIPPGTIGENMSVQPIGEVGCVDPRSIAPWRGNVIFVGQGGIWVTNGVGFDSMIEKDDGSGITSYWRDLYDVVSTNGGIFSGGIYGRDYYFLSCSYGGTLADTLVCYMPRKAWTRISNVGVRSYAAGFIGINELYGATIQGMPGNRVVKMSSVFNPDASNRYDANGAPVAPQIQLRMIGEGTGLKTHGHGHVSYDLRDAASDNPTLDLSAALGIEADTGFMTVQEGSPLPETTKVTRRRYMVNRDGQTLNLRLVQTGASAQTEIYAVEQEVRNYNITADGS